LSFLQGGTDHIKKPLSWSEKNKKTCLHIKGLLPALSLRAVAAVVERKVSKCREVPMTSGTNLRLDEIKTIENKLGLDMVAHALVIPALGRGRWETRKL
jgi:hypothetical protein